MFLILFSLNARGSDTTSYDQLNYLTRASGEYPFPSVFYRSSSHGTAENDQSLIIFFNNHGKLNGIPATGHIIINSELLRCKNLNCGFDSFRANPFAVNRSTQFPGKYLYLFKQSIDKYNPSGFLSSILSISSLTCGKDVLYNRLSPMTIFKKPESLFLADGLQGKYHEYLSEFTKYSEKTKKANLQIQELQYEKEIRNKILVSLTESIPGVGKEMAAARDNLNKLKKRYRKIEDSEDFTSAKKKKSANSKKVYVGGNFCLPEKNPFVFDLKPYIEYHFIKNAWLGSSASISLYTDLNSSPKISVSGGGAGFQIAYGLNHFFMQGESEIRFSRHKPGESGHNYTVLYHLGIGKEFQLANQWITRILLSYNLNFDGSGFYRNPVNVQMGIKRNLKI